jgi:hypothetical protein
MTSPENHHPEAYLPHHEEDDSLEGFIERVKALYDFDRTAVDSLLELSRDETKTEQFEALLDDLTYEALSDNPEFLENIKIVTEHTVSREQQKEVTDRQRVLFDEYKAAILRQAGVSSEHVKSEMSTAKERIKSLVEAELATDPGSRPHEILLSLGMLTEDDEGQEIFTYPEALFPKSTDAKWSTYLETVRTHLKIEKAVKAKLRAPVELEEADTARRIAHNAVSRDVDELLGFEKLPSSEWDFEKTRELLAKIRDSRFPTVETGEKFATERAVIQGLIGEHAIRALRTRLSDLHK